MTESERKRIPHLDSRDTLPIPPVTCVMNGESDFACDLMNCVSPSGHRRGCLPLRWLPIDARIKNKISSLCFGAISSAGTACPRF